MSDYYAPIDPDELKRERAKARELRQSPWWKRRISAGVCHYCRRQVGIARLTMDHVVPLGRGGAAAAATSWPRARTATRGSDHSFPWNGTSTFARSLSTTESVVAARPPPHRSSPPSLCADAYRSRV